MYENYDGKITIGTDIDTKGLEKGIKESEKKLENFRKEQDNLKKQKLKIEADVELDFNKTKAKVKAIQDKLQIDINALPVGRAGNIRETKLRETAQLRINQIEEEANRKLIERTELLDEIDAKIQNIEKSSKMETANILKQQINLKAVKEEQEEINKEKEKQKQLEELYGNIGDKIGDINKGLRRTIIRVGRWALALFGVRTMFAFIRSSMSTIAQGDKQMKADIDYIKGALAYSLYPLIKLIVEWAKKIVFYIGYIIQKWFNYNIFKDANKYLENANKNANKLVKTMAQFDEMNKLSEQGEETTKPSFDLTNYTGIEVPEWVKWIADNKEKILEVLHQLGEIFAIGTILGWLANISHLFTGAHGLIALSSLLGQIVTLASFVIIGYVAYSVWEDIRHLKGELNTIREYGANAIKDIAENMTDIEEQQDEINVRLTAGYDALKKSSGILGGEYLKNAESIANNHQLILEKEIEIYNQGKLNSEQKEKVLQNLKDQITYNTELINKLKQQGKDTSELEKNTQRLMENANRIYQEVNNTESKLYYMSIREWLVDIKLRLQDSEFYKSLAKVIENLKNGLSDAWSTIKLGLGNAVNKIKSGFAVGGIVYNLPKLASGGIINQPGHGVPLGQAIGGERGAEGVIPLTDSQQMEILGATIGKYINLNATIPVYVGNRQVARELKKIEMNDNFAFNR